MPNLALKHWSYHLDIDNIAWLSFNLANSSVNKLSSVALIELASVLDQLETKLPTALVIQSSKQAGFIVGADIEEFTRIETEQEVRDLVSRGQLICKRIESLPIATIALIHGFCLGGGLELALACDYRIAEDDPSCRLGLPEVRLGIHPAFGGTVRLLETVGATTAMDLMLSGRSVIARSAAKMGLVDRTIAKRHFNLAVADYIKRTPNKRSASKTQQLMNYGLSRTLLAKYLKKQVANKARQQHYPAPYALIDLWQQHGDDREAMFQGEIDSIVSLATHPSSRNLVRVFFLQEAMKKAAKSKTADAIKRVHVIGAGVMGGDIAAWSALQGLQVTLQDRNPESITRALHRARKLFKKKLKIDRAVQAAMDRLSPDLKGDGISKADLIIEAIFEDLSVKQSVFKEVEQKAKPDAILASNTSSIPIEKIATALSKPSRLVGIHFFNPVAKMQLIEIVSSAKTLKKVAARAAAFAVQIKRLPIHVKSSPGFLVNRVLVPYLIEAVYLHREGIAMEAIDEAALQYGMPMGPVELADVVGLDICKQVAQNILGKENVPQELLNLVESGSLGKKSGKGFYQYKKGKVVKQKAPINTAQIEEIQNRLIFPLLNESVACLEQGIVADADSLDGGVIFGTGYAPFMGGPINTIRDRDPSTMLATLNALFDKHGDRYQPQPGWESL